MGSLFKNPQNFLNINSSGRNSLQSCICPVLFLVCAVISAQQVPNVEMNVLSEFYNSTNGNSWLWRNDVAGAVWNFTLDTAGDFMHNPCSNSTTSNRTWQGITCSQTPLICSSQTCHITGLSLASYELSGFIPPKIGNLVFLEILNLNDNQLTGPIPQAVGDLIALTYLSLNINELTGSIPSQLGQLEALTFLDLDVNRLTSSLPSELGDLTALASLYIGQTYITGSIPSSIGQLTALTRLALYMSQLSGSIPSVIGNLRGLDACYLNANFFSGSIPSSIGQLTGLEILALSKNLLTGTIPSLQQLTRLQHASLHNNMHTGTIPSDMGQMVGLEILEICYNQLSGIIPSALGQLLRLEILQLDNNLLTGTFPSSISGLQNLEELRLQHNLLGGSLPAKMSTLRKLVSLFLQYNLLTGNIQDAFNHSAQLELSTVDISSNRLTGPLSAEMFLLPQLKVVSLSVNCFEDELPSSICFAKYVEVLSLNGLRAAEGCADTFVVPLSGVSLFNTIHGTVPSCVWDLPNLNVLHLTGNGLSGELVQFLPTNSQIADLSLSHNQLVGTIPLDILNIDTLDLSYNQFGGEYQDRTKYKPDSNISLRVNRLSGQLPVSELERVSNGSLSILEGNMFSCNSIPNNDDFSREYVCGSQEFNDSLFLFVIILGIAVLLVVIAMSTRLISVTKHHLTETLRSKMVLLWTYMTYLKELDTRGLDNKYSPAVRKIATMSASFVEIMEHAVKLLVLILVGSTALYVVKALDTNEAYATHSHTHAWFWTLAYMRGVFPAAMLLLLWTGAISVCFYRIVVYPMRRNDGGASSTLFQRKRGDSSALKDALTTVGFRDHALFGAAAFIFNICITIVVNTLYIYSTQQRLSSSTHFGIQLSLSIFRLVYVVVAFPLISQPIRNVVENVRFRFILLTINNLLIPCVVTALTSDACFQGLLIPADTVSTPYSYHSCTMRSTPSDGGDTYCSRFSIVEADSASLVPPFLYNNQCGSEILTSFIPVLMLGYSIQLLLTILAFAFLPYVPYVSMSHVVLKIFHGVICPDYWLQGGDLLVVNKALVKRDPRVLLKIQTVFCNDVLNNWLLMLTFGLFSPVLAAAIACVVVLKMFLWVFLIGRFTRCALQAGCVGGTTITTATVATKSIDGTAAVAAADDQNGCDVVHFSLAALAAAYTPLFEVLARAFWRLVWCSALFVSLLGWDMAADDVGWLRSLWIPLVSFGYTLVLRGVAHYVYHDGDDENQETSNKVVLPRESSCISQSPLHSDMMML